jgi:hypothetical protein
MTYLSFYQHEIDEEDDKVMFDVFVGEVVAGGAVGEAYALSESAVVGFGVGGVEDGDGVAAVDAYWHCYMAVGW